MNVRGILFSMRFIRAVKLKDWRVFSLGRRELHWVLYRGEANVTDASSIASLNELNCRTDGANL